MENKDLLSLTLFTLLGLISWIWNDMRNRLGAIEKASQAMLEKQSADCASASALTDRVTNLEDRLNELERVIVMRDDFMQYMNRVESQIKDGLRVGNESISRIHQRIDNIFDMLQK